jgi:hypothetical protein
MYRENKIFRVVAKEDIKEQPTSRNLSATATRVLQRWYDREVIPLLLEGKK